jgi:uncharacterized circularly permuted ATP-grasp superfamily protein/uncharacterized alpha-E superfamily protein
MSTVGTTEQADIFATYHPDAGSYDELRSPDGALRPAWARLLPFLSRLGLPELVRREKAAARQLQENGATYNVHDDAGVDHPWELDAIPFVISQDEWRSLAAGLAQRAQLLDRLLADVYGPQHMLREGILPPAAVFDHPSHLHACQGVAVPDQRYLHAYAADLVRGPDGRWRVLRDLAQAPSGAGYALENRIVLSRLLGGVFRECQVQRLALFFQTFRETLQRLAQRHRDNPRIVMLSAGPRDATYFEHAFLARYLGHPLVESEDLAVRGDDVYLKMLGGLQPVDVILRRLEDRLSDPLELHGQSASGVPGLLHAVRAGHVSVANALGSGLADSLALHPFLPALSRQLTGQELQLESVPSRWCGDPAELARVREERDSFLLTRADGVDGELAWNDEVAEALAEMPHRWVARERVVPSTIPALEAGHVLARRLILRVFVTLGPDGYDAMPGGLARAFDDESGGTSALAPGGVSKDTWVLADAPVSEFSLLHPAGAPVEISRGGGDLPSRVADNLYWLGRYAERAEFYIRVARELLIQLSDRPEGATLPALPALLQLVGLPTELAFEEEQDYQRVERDVAGFLFGATWPSGLRQTVEAAVRTASVARDRLSADTWRMLNRIEIALAEESSGAQVVSETLDVLDRLIVRLTAFGGISMESMTRGQGWRFLDLGRRLERSIQMTGLIRSTMAGVAPHEGALLEHALTIADSAMTYRRRYLTTLQVAPVLDLLMVDDSNPRSLGHQVDAMAAHVEALPRPEGSAGLTDEQRIALGVQSAVRLADVRELAQEVTEGRRVRLQSLLDQLEQDMPRLSDALTRRYLSHARPSRQVDNVVT